MTPEQEAEERKKASYLRAYSTGQIPEVVPPQAVVGHRLQPRRFQFDKINHPAHYNMHPANIECIEVTEYMSFNIGNAVKYLWRAGLKDKDATLEDLEKAIWYINREIQRLGLRPPNAGSQEVSTDASTVPSDWEGFPPRS